MLHDREAATLLGARRYQGPDCEAGHGGERYTERGTCVACEAESARAYRLAHRERQRPLRRERRAAWRKANPDKRRAERAAYRERNAERLRDVAAERAALKAALKAAERERMREAKAAERAALKARRAAARAAWIADAPRRRLMRDRAKAAQRRALKRGARGAATADQIATIRALQSNRCAYCGEVDRLHLDHRVAVARGGQHVPSNLQWLCEFHNISKGPKDDSDYRALNGIPPVTPWDVATGLYREAALM